MGSNQQTRWVEQLARALGFDLCGVAPVEEFPELERLPEWLAQGYAGDMGYLHDTRRRSPARALPGARSLIVCALNYNTALPYSTEVPIELAGQEAPGPEPLPSGPRGWISRYAWGNDYHEVLRSKLEALVAAMHAKSAEPFEARAYVDTGPIVERVAASYAGLGWLAKNTCLINPQLGSWLFLGVILTTLELAPSLGAAEAPPPDLCGNCRLCIDACPTGAIVEPYLLDARRCISYLTIELRGAIPDEFRTPMGRHVFGCDICQDVCPWNRAAPQTSVSAFLPRQLKTREIPRSLGSLGMTGSGGRHSEPAGVIPSQARNPSGARDEPGEGSPSLKRQFTRAREDNPPVESDVVSLFAPRLEWLASLSEEEYREVFRGSALKRAKWRGLVRNACVALGNCGARPGRAQYTRIVALLERLAASDDALIAEHARWALARLRLTEPGRAEHQS